MEDLLEVETYMQVPTGYQEVPCFASSFHLARLATLQRTLGLQSSA